MPVFADSGLWTPAAVFDYTRTMFETLLTWITDKAASLRETYAVNPWILLFFFTALAPPFYFSIYKMVRSAAAGRRKQMKFWLMIFLILTAAPYVYILIWGRNLPWYIYGVIAILLGHGLYSGIHKVRRMIKASGKN